VKECRTGVQKKRREWRRAQKQKENRKQQMPDTPPQQEEETPKSRLTQVWRLGNGLEAMHYHHKQALDELRAEMADMQNVRTHEFALCILPADKESVTTIRIRKNMPVSPASTEALTVVTAVVPCMKVGENCYEDESEWQQVMEDHTAEDSTRQGMVWLDTA
jgi:hypothetical protein